VRVEELRERERKRREGRLAETAVGSLRVDLAQMLEQVANAARLIRIRLDEQRLVGARVRRDLQVVSRTAASVGDVDGPS